jgi:hypothetical protein
MATLAEHISEAVDCRVFALFGLVVVFMCVLLLPNLKLPATSEGLKEPELRHLNRRLSLVFIPLLGTD